MPGALQVEIIVLADDVAGTKPRGILGQHGFSAAVRITTSSSSHVLLFDTGQYGEAVIHNAELLGLDLASIELVVLSHNHYDHTGGLLAVLDKLGSLRASSRNSRIPVVSHPHVYLPSIHISGDQVRLDIGAPFTEKELVEHHALPLKTRNPLQVAPATYYLGEIERVRPDLAPGLPGNYTITSDGELVEHPLLDDTGLAIRVEGKGVVVIGGCSHSGITNIALKAEKLLKDRVYAVIGGFHMASYSRDRILETVEELKRMGVQEAYPGHCTGDRASLMILEELRGRRLAAGAKIVFK